MSGGKHAEIMYSVLCPSLTVFKERKLKSQAFILLLVGSKFEMNMASYVTAMGSINFKRKMPKYTV